MVIIIEVIELANKVRKKVNGKVRSKFKRKSDKQMEYEAMIEENVSIFVMGIIVLLCLVVGIGIGVYLYDMALSNSAVVFSNLFKLLF